MATIKGDYWLFYLEGRGEKRLLKHDIAEEELAENMVLHGTPLREAIAAACLKAAVPLETGRRKRQWQEEHKEAIGSGDAEAAYAAYLQGRVDELAYALEELVLTELGNRFEAAEGGEEDEEDEEEEDL